MTKSCLECLTSGFNMNIGYILCISIIIFCLTLTPSKEGFTNKLREKKNKFYRKFRRFIMPYKENLLKYIHRLKRKL